MGFGGGLDRCREEAALTRFEQSCRGAWGREKLQSLLKFDKLDFTTEIDHSESNEEGGHWKHESRGSEIARPRNTLMKR